MSSSHSHSEFSEASEHVRLPLTTSRRRYVFPSDDENVLVDVRMKWKAAASQRCDLELCAVVFDFEGNLMDAAHFDRDSTCPGVQLVSSKDATATATATTQCGNSSRSPSQQQQQLRISFNELHPLANVVMVFVSCSPGNELRDLAEGSRVEVWDSANGAEASTAEQELIYTMSLKQNDRSLFSKSASMIVCRFYKRDTGNQSWELLTIGQCCDIGIRFTDLAGLLVDHFPVAMKEEGLNVLKNRVRQQAAQKLDFTKEAFVDERMSGAIEAKDGTAVSFCLGWDAQYGRSRSMHYLDANVISYGRFGTRLDLVDNIATCSRDGSTTINLSDYRFGNRTDEAVRIDLAKVASNVHAIVFVAIATSDTTDSGFFRMRSPYMRLKHIGHNGEEREIYRYAVPQKYMHEDAKEKSIIVAKLTRDHDNSALWRLSPISEFSTGNHGAYDEILIDQIDRHIDKLEVPDVEFLSLENPVQPLKSTNGIIVDFGSMNNVESVHVLQFNEFGKDVNVASRTFLPRTDDSNPQPLFTLRIPSKQRSIARYRYLPYDFSELEEAGVCTVLWVVSPPNEAEDGSEPLENSLVVIDKEEKVDICMCYFGVIRKPMLAMKLFKNRKNEWRLKYMGKEIPIPLNGQVSMLRFARGLRSSFKKQITLPEVRNMQPNEKLFVRKEDAEHLVFGFGFEGSTKQLLKSGKFVHHVRGEMELYDNFSEYCGVVYENQGDVKNCKFHDHRHLLLNATADDEEQISVKRTDITTVRYRALNMEAKSRALISSDDRLYVRVCDQETGKEIARMTVNGSAFLSGYTAKQKPSDSISSDIEGGMSDDESDGGSIDGTMVTMLVVKQSTDGWMLRSVGKAIPDPREYMDPQPKMIEVTIISAKDLMSADGSGLPDPFTKIKLTEKHRGKSLVKKKKQKFRTQIKKKTANPVWNEKFDFKIFHPEDVFTIAVVDHDIEVKVNVPVAVALACENVEQEMRLVRKSHPEYKPLILVRFKRIG